MPSNPEVDRLKRELNVQKIIIDTMHSVNEERKAACVAALAFLRKKGRGFSTGEWEVTVDLLKKAIGREDA